MRRACVSVSFVVGTVPTLCGVTDQQSVHVGAVPSQESAPDHFRHGNELLHEGDYRGAERAYRNAATLNPTDPAFLVNLGTVLSKQGEVRQSEAEAVCRSAVALDPHLARTHFALGQVLLQGKRGGREGLRRLSRAVALDPQDADMHSGLGRTALRFEQFNTAVRHLHAAAVLKPYDAQPRDQLGYALSKVEKLSESRSWLESSLRLSPSRSAVAKLVEVLLWLGDERKARSTAQYAVDNLLLWRHPLQRPTSLYRPELFAKPWWSPDDAVEIRSAVSALSRHAVSIREEFSAVQRQRPGGWRHQPERIQEPGLGRWKEWKVQDERNSPCRHAIFPQTCRAIGSLGHLIEVQWAEFSVLEPGTHIRPHTGPTNDRLTLHLCLSTTPGVMIRVGDGPSLEYHSDSVLLFDDSFEHEVWHSGSHERIVLLVQFAHPGLLASNTE